ncbi:MAG: metalloregulator ArsR/SmtB family transcription factor [Clostridiales bacterium]|nr:metalloregulator ArsR/SmtB family transcription factor [Clostridiales bacterium]
MGKKKKEKKSSKSIKAKSSKKKSLQEKFSEEESLQEKSSKENLSKKKPFIEKSSKENLAKTNTSKKSPQEMVSTDETLSHNAAPGDWNRNIPAVFQALSDENRLKILNLLSEREMCSAELLQSVAVAQSTMSHHMKVLNESGLISCRRDGKRICYTIRQDTMEQLESMIRHWKHADGKETE